MDNSITYNCCICFNDDNNIVNCYCKDGKFCISCFKNLNNFRCPICRLNINSLSIGNIMINELIQITKHQDKFNSKLLIRLVDNFIDTDAHEIYYDYIYCFIE